MTDMEVVTQSCIMPSSPESQCLE